MFMKMLRMHLFFKAKFISVIFNFNSVYCHQEKSKMFAKGTEITVPVVVKKLNEILQARGKKGTDR